MLKTILIASLLALPTLPSLAQSSEPLCYWELRNRSKLSLESLCDVNKRQSVNIRFAQSSASDIGLKVSNIGVKKVIIRKEERYMLFGSITNTSSSPKSSTQINYSAYKQSGKSLKKNTFYCSVDANYLLPGDTSNCKDILFEKPDFIIVESVEEFFKAKEILNTCYTGTSKGEQLCRLLSPSSIQRY